jgi:hypothetical protein
MDTGQLVARAEHALRTGQPNLAVLYMRRALSESPEGRAWLAFHDFRAGVIAAAAAVGMLFDGYWDAVTRALGGDGPRW